MAPIRIDP